ncbi:hypothetical protein RTE01_04290 [Raoultella terrigena]|jgi:hypothetical protein|uniref:Uncharacterized protein n=1 Tax=Raoultella terrigena TaxID=577 RepID=A0A485BL02_RAOTE|nr:hypothetical protein RTE01_04290 [Raoultella terrigena]VFS72943.1 Uncharacterised protein [Raoultella terrigena]
MTGITHPPAGHFVLVNRLASSPCAADRRFPNLCLLTSMITLGNYLSLTPYIGHCIKPGIL